MEKLKLSPEAATESIVSIGEDEVISWKAIRSPT
jgi:hypothetical protein